MSARHAAPFVALAAALALAPPVLAAEQDYLVMGTPHVNVRTGPGTGYAVVGKAEKGDLFQITGETEGWWEVRMFSGDARFISKEVRVYPLTASQIVPGHAMILPESPALCRSMHRSVLMGLDRAQREAEELLPRDVEPGYHDDLRRVLEDRILLEMFHILGVQPALYGELMAMEWPGAT